jgi:hypothetical protein
MDDIKDRIEALKQKAAALVDGQMRAHVSADCPAEVEEQFWRRVVAFESAPEVEVEPFQLLAESGLSLPSPETLEDAALTSKLWEVIHGLAAIGVYLYSTDHLTDRELYVRLWRDVLRDPMELTNDDGGVWIVDLAGSGSEEDLLVYLKYYADEEARRRWAQEWPDDPLPLAEDPPFDRDRHLPQAFIDRESSPSR